MSLSNRPPERLLHESEAARLLAVSPRTLRNWRTLGHGPVYVKISGRCVRYRQSDLVNFIDEKSQKHSSQSASAFEHPS
ncbi:MAG: helix-turn-helix domain-containing protein [Pseudomonadota bacterium]